MKKPSMNMAALCLLVAAGAVSAEADNLEAGKQVYEATCSHCHDSGKMGAPVLSDASEWTDRSQIPWTEVHTLHLEDGLLRDAADDPKKGVTAEQMEAATDYMMSIVTKK